jgi:hypothetical protein
MGELISTARKRRPLVVNGETVELDAPGFELRERNNGARDQYWIATAAARTRGYLPRMVRLHYDRGGSAGRHDLEPVERSPTKCWLGLLILPTRASPYTTGAGRWTVRLGSDAWTRNLWRLHFARL